MYNFQNFNDKMCLHYILSIFNLSSFLVYLQRLRVTNLRATISWWKTACHIYKQFASDVFIPLV